MRRTALAITALVVALSACSSTSQPTSTLGARAGGGGISAGGFSGKAGAVDLVQGALISFQECDEFLAHVKAEAIERVAPYGLEWYGGWPYPMPLTAMAEQDAAGAPPTTAASTEAGRGSFSTTNNQEIGVDEADIVKTDGRRIVVLTNSILSVVDVTGTEPKLVGSLQIDPQNAVRDLFLYDDTVVLLGSSWGATPVFAGAATRASEAVSSDAIGMVAPEYYGSPVVSLTEVDISSEPVMTRTLQLDGAYLTSRMIDGVARIAVSSGPTGFVWAYPEGQGLRAERTATEANKRIIEESTIANWVPYHVLSDAEGNVIREGAALACNRAHHPPEFAGFNMLSIVTVDLATGLDIIDSTGVMASGETLYSSTDSVYVATSAWLDPRILAEGDADAAEETFAGGRTQIHQFDISGRTTEYVATGSVRGYLLNQFAMSEHNGDLRVATTTTPNWWGFEGGSEESLVTVLRPDDGELAAIGVLDGLGKDERIYSVRFMGDVAYLVTFRQVDPLFTIDLSDPTDPMVRGELKIPGFSAYLHPVNDSIVLGIGQDATPEGRVQGSQISLFDVSNPDDPVRIARLALGKNSNSTAEYDHRAFLQWGDTVIVPLTEYLWDNDKASFFTGAVAVDIRGGDLREITRIAHPESNDPNMGWNASILRSVVVADDLYTISNLGILQSDLATLERTGWLSLPSR